MIFHLVWSNSKNKYEQVWDALSPRFYRNEKSIEDYLSGYEAWIQKEEINSTVFSHLVRFYELDEVTGEISLIQEWFFNNLKTQPRVLNDDSRSSPIKEKAKVASQDISEFSIIHDAGHSD